ncbi:MAG: carboxypeptidase regulatory-like domain-containing protein, partial [Nitrospirae bacterium]|nr:carboxypeptidase regulatory-like domain-containing protein [Nitrospirota bacterium]
MKRLLSVIALILLWTTSAFSYTIKTIANIPLTDNLTGISINPSTNTAAAISRETKTLYLIDTQTNTITKKISLEITPSGIAVDTNRNQVIVSSSDGILQFIDFDTGNLIKGSQLPNLSSSVVASQHPNFSASQLPNSIAINSKTDILYIGGDSWLKAMDLQTGNFIKEVSISNPVIAMDIDPNLGYLVMLISSDILHPASDILHLYNSETLEPILSGIVHPASGIGYSGIAVNPSTHIAVLTNPSDNSITVVSLSSCILYPASCIVHPASGISLNEPTAISINPSRNIALISHKEGIATVKLENPIPLINTIIPSSSRSGDPGLTLSIKGEKFIKDSKTWFDTKELTTRFDDNFSLQADIPSSEFQIPRNVDVSVTNPPPGGGQSNMLTFSIYNPIPIIEYITPDSILLTGLPATIRIYGRNFMPQSVANLNGNNLKTKFISSILLEVEINSTVITSTGKYAVIVTTPPPGAFASNAVYLNVVEDVTGIGYPASDIQYQESGIMHQASANQSVGALTGRILNTNKEPIEGVTIKIKNISTTTDSNGYFTLENVPSGKQHLMIRGSTARHKDARYPTIPLTVNIQADMINEMPFQIYLHKQKNKNFKDINPNEDTILTDPEVPGFELRIPKGVNITGWDGKPNQKISVRTVPIDRLPVKPLPQNANVRTVYMFYFDKEGGGVPDQPIPIKSKNDLGLLPGEKAVLWYYDESPNEGEAPNDWAIAGTGTVTPDGKYIVSDPGVGIPKFCCGATAWGGTSASTESSGDNGSCGLAGDPVDVATGYFIHEKTDLQIPGIIPVNITRYYRSRDSGSAVTGTTGLGAFGKGMYLEYDWWMGSYDTDSDGNIDMFLLIKPGNYQYRFDVQQTGGTFINDSDPSMRGAVITKNADNTKSLKMRDGWTYKFDTSGDLIEIADRNGNKLTFTRHSDFEGGYLSQITTPEGRTLAFTQTYTGNFWRTDSITESSGRTIAYTYETDPFSSYPRLKKVTYPDGGSIEYQYDSSGRLYSIKNERGILEVTNEYNTDNRVIKQTHADGGIYTFSYTTAGGNISETSMTSPNGAVTTWRFYDDLGNFYDKYIVKKITPDGATTYERQPGTNLLLSVTDPLNRKTIYTYYPNGQIHTVTDNLNNVTSYEYEPVYGLPSKITDANLKDTIITYTYDANNKITKIETQDPLLKKTTVNFNTNGMPTDITDPNLNTTWFFYE